ncbi:MAG TPA: class II aldolase/adducin family protein [Candidatus Elarobacter sp.]|jgi:HCOMODA/2-hydroxy-3-carboxy-muconic semialdehyde decarboxylase
MDRRQFAVGVLAAAAFPTLAAAAPPPPTRDDLALANRILAHEGVVDGFGHVSVRDPANPGRYWLARSMAPALVTPGDILTYDLQSTPLDANGAQSYLERFIHGAIYAARPDVQSVVHAHTPAVIPFGVSRVPLRAVFHMGAFLGAGGVPIFEIRDTAGSATNLLVSTNELGAALARTLGSANVALMRGHGMVTVGTTIPEAVFRAYYTGADAQLESDALRLGPVNFLTADEAKAATQTQSALVSRSWELWKVAASRS